MAHNHRNGLSMFFFCFQSLRWTPWKALCHLEFCGWSLDDYFDPCDFLNPKMIFAYICHILDPPGLVCHLRVTLYIIRHIYIYIHILHIVSYYDRSFGLWIFLFSSSFSDPNGERATAPSPTLGACLRLATIKVNAAAAQPDVFLVVP